ncbi:hypothetical protein GCM10010991_37300 [Gemmobacter aquaticus]|uniref:Uncharacterized protein n=1 Tax=Gemmobacter aquaticus TaxID=490185 RepID=A0A917YNY4_9RHOB|nr:hypothetical protein GCM10010991_37300 [Gemmobacter aquaticus]
MDPRHANASLRANLCFGGNDQTDTVEGKRQIWADVSFGWPASGWSASFDTGFRLLAPARPGLDRGVDPVLVPKFAPALETLGIKPSDRNCCLNRASRLMVMAPQNTKWVSGIDANTTANAVRIAVARKLAVIVHAMWKTNTPFPWSQLDA